MMTRDADKKREQMLMFCMDDWFLETIFSEKLTGQLTGTLSMT